MLRRNDGAWASRKRAARWGRGPALGLRHAILLLNQPRPSARMRICRRPGEGDLRAVAVTTGVPWRDTLADECRIFGMKGGHELRLGLPLLMRICRNRASRVRRRSPDAASDWHEFVAVEATRVILGARCRFRDGFFDWF
jgi:hypothetical protein